MEPASTALTSAPFITTVAISCGVLFTLLVFIIKGVFRLGGLFTEVGFLTQKVDTLDNQVGNLTQKVETLSDKVDTLYDKFDTLSDKVDGLEKSVQEVRVEIAQSNQELRAEIARGNQQLREEIAQSNRDLRDEIRRNTEQLLNALAHHRHADTDGGVLFTIPPQPDS